jgi:hypothetical protein
LGAVFVAGQLPKFLEFCNSSRGFRLHSEKSDYASELEFTMAERRRNGVWERGGNRQDACSPRQAGCLSSGR